MLVDIRWLPLLLSNIVIVLATQYTNNLLSPLFLYVYIGAAFIISPAFLLGYKGGAAVVILTSLFFDAGTTGTFGLATPLFLIGFIVLYMTRNNIKRNSIPYSIIFALCANAILFLIMAILLANDTSLTDRAYWQHIIMDFIVSEIAVLFIVPYLQFINKTLFDVFNLNPVNEEYIA